MTRREYSIWDPDLVAYADRQLDPERAAEIARYLEESPEVAACVREIHRQNAALKEAFEPELDEPLPERLRELVYGRPANQQTPLWRRGWARSAAAVAVVVTAGWSGWMLGQEDEPAGLQTFLNDAAMTYATGAGSGGPLAADMAGQGLNTVATASADPRQPLNWLSERISLELEAPDLSHLGLTLIAKRGVDIDNQKGVELVYAQPDDQRVSVFLKTRWTEQGGQMRTVQARGQTMAYWLDGPLVYAVATPESGDAAEELAHSIQGTIAAGLGDNGLALEPAPAGQTRGGGGVVSVEPPRQPPVELQPMQPATPQPLETAPSAVQTVSDSQTM